MTLLADDVAPRSRLARVGLLAVVFVCAACGLVYELALVSLGSYLIGNTATQASIVLAVMVFAMGVGSLAAKPLQQQAVTAFAAIELALALLGGLSVLALYAAFAYLSLYTQALVVVAFVLGLLIGAEIPLLMVLLQRIASRRRVLRSPTCSPPTTSEHSSAVCASRSYYYPCSDSCAALSSSASSTPSPAASWSS